MEKNDQFNPPQEMMDEGKFEKVEKRIDVWYSGVLVMGTNIVLQWKLEENMVRPNQQINLRCLIMWLVRLECIKASWNL